MILHMRHDCHFNKLLSKSIRTLQATTDVLWNAIAYIDIHDDVTLGYHSQRICRIVDCETQPRLPTSLETWNYTYCSLFTLAMTINSTTIFICIRSWRYTADEKAYWTEIHNWLKLDGLSTSRVLHDTEILLTESNVLLFRKNTLYFPNWSLFHVKHNIETAPTFWIGL